METSTVVEKKELPDEDGGRALLRQVIRRIKSGEAVAPALGIGEAALRAFEQQAFTVYRQGQFEQARSLCLGILALNRRRASVHLMMGDMAMRDHRFDEALEFLEEAVELEPADYRAQRRLGEVLLKLGRVDEALEWLSRVKEVEVSEASRREVERADVLISHARQSG